MDWLPTISPEGRTVLFETENIQSIQLMQPLNIMDNSMPHYMVVILYKNGAKEQTVISHEVWEMWNQWQAERNTNEDK